MGKELIPQRTLRVVWIGLACFAFAWAVVRACVQAITGDEAASYLYFASPNSPSHWTASATNHILNSALMRLFTSILGLSPLTVRLPALVGAAIYIYVCYRLCQIISEQWAVRFPLLICRSTIPSFSTFS